MTFPTTSAPSNLRPTLVGGVWDTSDHRFMAGEYLPSQYAGWVLDYWPTGLLTPGHDGPIRLIADNLAHARQLVDWVMWAETEGARRG